VARRRPRRIRLQAWRAAEQAYVRYWHARASLIASERIIATLEDLERLARSRYSAGLAAQQDAIRLQVERTRMLRERIERQALRRESAVRLNGLLARAPDASLDEPQGAPQLDVPPSALDPAVGDNAMHPAVAAEVALLEAAEQRRERVRRERYPDLTVGLAPIQVGNRLEAWELMFEVELPLQQASRRSREREAILMRDAASARRDAVKSRIDAEAAEARSAWEAAQAQRRLVESTLLPQTAASFESALGAYGAGTSDFSTLLDAQRERRSAELTLLDATRDALLAAATLRSLAGESP
jgi:outer membrane protein TolC